MRPIKSMPLPVKHALRKLGAEIAIARRARRIPSALLAERARICRTTLNKVEKGDAAVAFGIYATVLFCLGLGTKIGDLAANDAQGRYFMEEALPKRVRLKTGN